MTRRRRRAADPVERAHNRTTRAVSCALVPAAGNGQRGEWMYKVAAVYPVLPGKDARSVAAILRRDPGAYTESRRHAGVLLERAYEQQTPMGVFLISYLETERPFPEV